MSFLDTAPIILTRDGRDGFPAESDFNEQVEDYLMGLNPKKRAKALMTQDMYGTILSVLLEPHSTAFATAQFRFWSKRMFRLVTTTHAHVVSHENRPVAVKDQIYSILVGCHGDAAHGGRDKTSAQVRRYYSWIPKELVSRFVKMCPLCIAKRRSQKPYFSDALLPPSNTNTGASTVGTRRVTRGSEYESGGPLLQRSLEGYGGGGGGTPSPPPMGFAGYPTETYEYAYENFEGALVEDEARPYTAYSTTSTDDADNTHNNNTSSLPPLHQHQHHHLPLSLGGSPVRPVLTTHHSLSHLQTSSSTTSYPSPQQQFYYDPTSTTDPSLSFYDYTLPQSWSTPTPASHSSPPSSHSQLYTLPSVNTYLDPSFDQWDVPLPPPLQPIAYRRGIPKPPSPLDLSHSSLFVHSHTTNAYSAPASMGGFGNYQEYLNGEEEEEEEDGGLRSACSSTTSLGSCAPLTPSFPSRGYEASGGEGEVGIVVGGLEMGGIHIGGGPGEAVGEGEDWGQSSKELAAAIQHLLDASTGGERGRERTRTVSAGLGRGLVSPGLMRRGERSVSRYMPYGRE